CVSYDGYYDWYFDVW
nr:immunoglobulin heavy chain junction region [Mus musculus]MBK4188781.1 immunoglobulin heavy chain junction region [Mus musculus]MBK4188782.1 immunoglobulin heavy chain junction region [Mus musculus]